MLPINQIVCGDNLEVLATFPDCCVDTCVTSPPYWGLRDYGIEGQLGLEPTPAEYVSKMVELFREVRRVLKDDGTLWLNLGDSYAGQGGTQTAPGISAQVGSTKAGVQTRGASNGKSRTAPVGLKPKDLCGIPWRVAFSLQADGWYLRSDIIWNKPNPMPESVTDRPTKAHEYIFLMSKSAKYYYDADAIKEPIAESSINRLEQDIENQIGTTRAHAGGKTNGNLKAVGDIENGRNKRSVWTVTTKPFKQAHFATFPCDLIKPCILAGCREGGVVLDPFSGAGTTALVARKNHCKYIGIELNADYCEISQKRLAQKNLFAVT